MARTHNRRNHAAEWEAMVGMTTAERIALEERRVARDEWRRAGGSERRPLKSFRTAEEKKAHRLEHAERISASVEYIRTERGFTDWLEARELCPRFSPLNAALIAYQCPGTVADTVAGWRKGGYRIRKGETCSGYVTGPNFWPIALFTADQVGASDLAEMAEDVRPCWGDEVIARALGRCSRMRLPPAARVGKRANSLLG